MSDVWGESTRGSAWLTMLDPQPWVADALCAQIGGDDIWFPPHGRTASTARKVCESCPVMAECREYAIESPEPLAGIWGGLGARQRQSIRASRKRDAA